jgi:hypothetical protein
MQAQMPWMRVAQEEVTGQMGSVGHVGGVVVVRGQRSWQIGSGAASVIVGAGRNPLKQ